MRVLVINHNDAQGGAAKAARRIFTGTGNENISVQMLVLEKYLNCDNTFSVNELMRKPKFFIFRKYYRKIKNRIRKQKWKRYPNKENVFLTDLNSIPLLKILENFDFDILHLHFIANGFVDIRELKKFDKPIVWTLHDSWPFTGICHYFYTCTNYLESCGRCPMLKSDNPLDFTNKIWKIKKKTYQRLKLNIVSPSKWLGKAANQSSLMGGFPLAVIPNPIDSNLFRPYSKEIVRKSLDLKSDMKYILFGAYKATVDSNKGFSDLVNALQYIHANSTQSIELIVFGSDKSPIEIQDSFPINYIGYIDSEEKMANIYNAANVTIVPSKSENLSYVIMESLSCGIPVVAYNIGGNSDLIDHKTNGYLANAFDYVDLATGIIWCIENNTVNELSENARSKVLENFSIEKVSRSYKKLYENLIKK